MPSLAYPQWKYRARVDITNPVNTASYQHQLTLAWRPGMRRDFSDIRFGNLQGTALSYWIEHTATVTGVSCVVWINIPAANTRQIYLYYGNGSASNGSDGNATFGFFDDFLGNAYNTDKWGIDATYNNGTVTVANSIVSVIGSVSPSTYHGFLTNNAVFTTNTVLEAYLKFTNDVSTSNIAVFGARKDAVSTTELIEAIQNSGKSWRAMEASTVSTLARSVSLNNIYNRISFARNGISTILFYGNGILEQTESVRVPEEDLKIVLLSQRADNSIYCDWVAIRQYTATEPTLSIGTHGPNLAYAAALLLRGPGAWWDVFTGENPVSIETELTTQTSLITSLKLYRPLTSSMDTGTALTAPLSRLRKLATTITTQTSLTAVGRLYRSLLVSMDTGTALTGSLARLRALTTTMITASGMSGTVKALRKLVSNFTTATSLIPSPRARKRLTAILKTATSLISRLISGRRIVYPLKATLIDNKASATLTARQDSATVTDPKSTVTLSDNRSDVSLIDNKSTIILDWRII
jgi:hypothetical protein